ncbi:hypothetical protein [Paracoccus versutus]|uniref:hypothetical protein n=1 Tax=Paracoccus versutus TaxID=34007 RepID=UPI003B8A98B7
MAAIWKLPVVFVCEKQQIRHVGLDRALDSGEAYRRAGGGLFHAGRDGRWQLAFRRGRGGRYRSGPRPRR